MNARGVVNQDIEREALECAGWNFEATDTEVLVCRNNHDKGAACDMRPMHPAEVLKLINRLRARVLELEHRAALASQQAVKGEPLTDEQIREWWRSENGLEDMDMCDGDDFRTVVRAIERAHGIHSREGGSNG